MRIDKFYRDSFILTLSNMVTGIIAFTFSILLSRELGAEGLGLYGLIMPVYGLLLCLTSDGLITAVSKISTVHFNRKDIKNLNKTISTAFVFIAAWASCVALIVMLCSSGFATYIVRDVRAVQALRIISPALVFVPLSSIIKGYFYGLGKYKVTASVDIVEKLLRVVILLTVISILGSGSVDKTVAIAYFALAVGELISLVLLYTCYRLQRSSIPVVGGKTKSRIQLLFDVFVISLPLCMNGILSSVLSTISTLVLPRRLMVSGMSYQNALELIGRFSGMALNITNLPYIIIGSMLTVLVPELSLHISKKDYWSAETRIAQVMRLACCIGAAAAIVCLVIPTTLGQVFYQRDDLGYMIRFSSIICLVSYIASPTFGILNALGRQTTLLKNSIIISVESLILIFILAGIPPLNIYGYGLSIILISITALYINIKEIRKICVIKINIQDICSLIMTGVIAYLLSRIAAGIVPLSLSVLRTAVVVLTSFGSILGITRLITELNNA